MFQGSLRAGLFRGLRSRHPLARAVTGALGLLALIVLVALGMFAVAALVIGGGLFLLVNSLRPARTPRPGPARPNAATPSPGVIEGEFKVVPNTPASRDARPVH